METWDDIKEKLLLRFGGDSQTASVYDRLMNLCQTRTVADYRKKFEEIMTSSKGIPQEFFKRAFLNRLK